MKRGTIKKRLRQRFYEKARDIPLGCIGNIVKAKDKFELIFWILCFVILSGTCSIFLINTVTEYLEFGVITKTRFINENEAVFPGVGICHSTPTVTQKSISLVAGFLEEKTEYIFENKTNHEKLAYLNEIIFTDKNLPGLIRTFMVNLNETQKKLFGLTAREIILNCQFKNGECSHLDFKWAYHIDFGNCFVFNHNNSLKIGKKSIKYLFIMIKYMLPLKLYLFKDTELH